MSSETADKVWDGRGEALSDARLTQADARMADDLRLKQTHFRVMAHVGRQNNKRGWLRVSQSELAERWGVHRNTVNGAFKELVAWGYLLQRTQEEAGESFCQYKVALDGETSEEHRTPKRAPRSVSQAEEGECTPETAPPHDQSQGGECTPESAHVHSGGVHPCTVGEYTPHIIPRAHRLSPDSAEEKLPPLPPRGEQGGEVVSGFTSETVVASGRFADPPDNLSAGLREALRQLSAERPHDPAIVRLIEPLLGKRRFSAAEPFAALSAACAKAKGLSPEHLDKALELILASGVKVVKAERLMAAIEAVRKGGLMLVITRGSPEFAAWMRHFEAKTPNLAQMMARDGKWQVPSRFPPGSEQSAAGGTP